MTTLATLVTGANSGIGKEIARKFAAAGHIVYVGSRDVARGRRAVEDIGGQARLLVIDVTVGGIMADGSAAPDADVDSFRRTYETNVFGVLAVINAFLPALRRSAHPRIVNVSSGTGSLSWSTGPNPQFAWQTGGTGAAYRSSKTALNALTVYYAQALAADGFKVNALAPGLRATNLNARAAASGGDPGEAAAGAVRLAMLPDDGPTGQLFSWDGTVAPW